jgi:hypothetical protein
VIGMRRAATTKGVAEPDECIGVVEVMDRKRIRTYSYQTT